MALMLAKTYAAFKAANVPDAEAIAAAEELAEHREQITNIHSDLRLLQWMVGGLYALMSIVIIPGGWLLLKIAAKVGVL
jgi:hypothetical protein